MLRLRVCELEAEVNKHQQEGEQLARLREELELQRKNYEEQHNTTLRELAKEREAVVQSSRETVPAQLSCRRVIYSSIVRNPN